MAKERHFTPPIFPPPKATRYECTNCGHILPKDVALPEKCPVCACPKEAFVLIEED
jgi:rubrerythrin